MEATVEMFEEIRNGKYEAYTSLAVIDEINAASEIKRQQLLELIKIFNLNILEVATEATELAFKYVREGIIPEKYKLDALHIAIATVEDMNIILSWNFKHIVKRKTIIMTGFVNSKEGYKSIDIYSPQEVIENDDF